MGESRPVTPRGRVLLIDDDRVFGLWATKVLQARGFEVRHVLDPMAGLRQIEAEPWDLVITDVEMPRMSGLEFLERARRLVAGLPVVVVTAHPTVDRAVTALRQPGTDFIHKPITAEDFAAKITALAAQQRPAQAAAPECVLAVGAHPGDVEIGAAGALLAHQAAGEPVTVLTLAPTGPGGTGPEDGRDPSETVRGIGTRLGLDDVASGGAGGGDPIGAAIGRLIADIQPTVLYTHSLHDAQVDHRDAYHAATAAAQRVGRVYCFQSPSATIEFRPARLVPIDDHIGGKLRAVGAFAAQAEVRDFLEPDQVTSTALYWGRLCEARHAEAFEVARDRTAAGAAASGRGTTAAAP
jgi:two-component system response regulator HydG